MYVEVELRCFKNITISHVLLAFYDSLKHCAVYLDLKIFNDGAFLKL